jgi:Ca-activated chloride channel homolog
MAMNESATEESGSRVGLLANGAPVPLEGVSVEAKVTGEFSRVTISQRYRNLEAHPIEAVYVFPLDEAAAVCGFEAVCDGAHYVGEVKPRDEAFEAYDDALRAGHGAFLLDEERTDVFTASVGNVAPGAEVLLRISYVTEMAMEGDALRFVLPTSVSPRYAPGEDRVGVGQPDAETLNPPTEWTVPYGLELAIDILMPGAITRVESPSHPLSISFEGACATVSLAQARAALDRDVVVLIHADGLASPHALVERDAAGQRAAAVVFRPVFDVDQAPSEVIFVVDRSGSMGGTSIAEVRNALQLCLRSLVPGSRFDITGFGSTFESLFSESVPYDEGTLAQASAYVAALDADLGGTEILPALESVLGRPRSEGLPRQLVIMTDGEVTNTDAVIEVVRKHASDTRVFTFGIGRGASAHLVRGIARAGNGAAEFIYPGERAEAKVLRQFARVLAPALTDLKLDWGGLDVRPAPSEVPAVFAGGQVIVYGLLDEVRPARVTLSARGTHGEVAFTADIEPADETEGSTLVTLTARALIRELEESPEWLTDRGSKQVNRKAGRVKAEIVRLAETYGLASRETSFVAVEHRAVPVEGEAVLRRIPVALTSGWGGLEDRAMSQLSASTTLHELSSPEAPMMLRESMCSLGSLHDSAPRASRRRRRPAREAARINGMDFRASSAERPLDRLVSLQRADGSWDLTAAFASAIGSRLSELLASIGSVAGAADPDRCWATALALAWLEHNAGDARDEWVLLARKAQKWLSASSAGEPEALNSLMQAAEDFVGR